MPVSLAPDNVLLKKLLQIDRLEGTYEKARTSGPGTMFENLLRELQVSCQLDPSDTARIPATGAVVAVANHPFGMLEGAVLGSALSRVRPDLKIMTNHLLAGLPELEAGCIFVDPFHRETSARTNIAPLKQAIRWLRSGGMLLIFPAGEVSHWDFARGGIADPEWSETVVRLIGITRAAALPIFINGRNSLLFQLLGMVHPNLRTASLPAELLNKRGKKVEVRIGRVIPFEAVAGIADDSEATRYLRWRTYALARRSEIIQRRMPQPFWKAPIAPEAPREKLIREIERLPAQRLLENSGEFSVYVANASEAPGVLQEIGRLREISFRAVGEGTGRKIDLDIYDSYYQHLFVWHKSNRELVGAYRVAASEDVLRRFGLKGLYTNTLFHYDLRLFERIGPALELGRSFIRQEYQKQYAPLLMLWKGILGYIISYHPEIAVLYGAVSISADYHPVSRQLLAQFLMEQNGSGELGGMVAPRHPFRPRPDRSGDLDAIVRMVPSLDHLSGLIADMEADGKGAPILLRHYAKLGAKLLGFNVDSKFSDALDGLILVDLRKTDANLLERYMSRDRAGEYMRRHSMWGGIPSRGRFSTGRNGVDAESAG
jgi:putative hemolysin